MIVGLGFDLVAVARIEGVWTRFGERFARRVLNEGELELLTGRNVPLKLAKLFAVKEAAGKALGTGVLGPVGFHHILLTHRRSGRPILEFIGPAHERFTALRGRRAHVSISDEGGFAAAVVVLESD